MLFAMNGNGCDRLDLPCHEIHLEEESEKLVNFFVKKAIVDQKCKLIKWNMHA